MIRRGMALGLALLALACGDDGTGPSADIPAELVAVWEAGPACAECSFTLFDRAQPDASIDLVQSPPFLTVALDIRATGRLSLFVRGPAADSLLTGAVQVQNGQLLVSAAGTATVDTLDYAIRGNLLDLVLRSQVLHDFDGNGSEESIGMRGTFRKR